jgi:hypothetical protein
MNLKELEAKGISHDNGYTIMFNIWRIEQFLKPHGHIDAHQVLSGPLFLIRHKLLFDQR